MEKKTLQKILTVSKPSHSEVSLIHVAKIDFGKTGEVEDITKKEKGIASCEFPKEKYNPESGTQCVRPFPIWKNKLLLNEYLGDFETLIFFCVETGLTPNPLFLNPPLNLTIINRNSNQGLQYF